MAEKKYVVSGIEGNEVILESEGQVVKVPLEEMQAETKRLREEGVKVPELKVGLEISVGDRCSYHWKMEGCISAYMHNL